MQSFVGSGDLINDLDPFAAGVSDSGRLTFLLQGSWTHLGLAEKERFRLERIVCSFIHSLDSLRREERVRLGLSVQFAPFDRCSRADASLPDDT